MAENTGLTASDVAAGDDVEDADHNTLVADLKSLRQISQTAGETISGATLPVACYLKSSDGEWYACDADDEDATEFAGFAITNGTNGNSIIIQFHGVVGGFSGLTNGSSYYIQDDKTIGTTPGTNQVIVGKAVSTTQIRIIEKSDVIHLYSITTSDILRASADTEQTHGTSTFTKKKEILVNETGVIRVKHDLKGTNTDTVVSQIYINGSSVTGNNNVNSTSYQTQTNDNISVEKGDLVQLYIKITTANTVFCRNFRLYWDKTPLDPYTVNLD